MSEEVLEKFETFVLLEHMNPHNMNLYRRIGKNERERIDKRRDYSPFLRSTITKNGKRVVIRYKETTDEIEQDKQIEKGIPANNPFTAGEYSALQFFMGTKTTNNPTVKKYLKEYAGFEGNSYTSTDTPLKEYKLLDFDKEAKDLNLLTRRKVEAVNKILSLDLDGTNKLLWLAYGTQYQTTDDVSKNQNTLIKYLDENEEAVDEILKEETTKDDEMNVLVARALSAGVLSFDANQGQVSKKKGTAWIDVKAVSADLEPAERIRQFVNFVGSDSGKLLKEDIEASLKKVK